jgi:Arc/MetJ-type ribon-helix-helix transcriptional regulator
MVTTINISLPKKLKEAADALVAGGEYASFSDLARSAIRDAVLERRYEAIIAESKREEALGTATVLNGPKDIDEFMRKFEK